MSDIRLDTVSGDLEIIEGNPSLTITVDAIRQHLSQRLKTFLGEWFLDSRIGVPYFQHILQKNPNPVVVDAVLKKEIIQTPGVEELIQFDVDIDEATREASLIFRVKTIAGEVQFSQLLGVIG